jgi:hypothetical protein
MAENRRISRPWKRKGLVLAAAAALGLAGAALTQTAASATPNPQLALGKQEKAPTCSLTPSADSGGGRDEWASCLQTGVTVANAVSVGQSTDITFTVQAQGDQKNVTIIAELSAGLTWMQVPTGFTATSSASAAPASGGSWNRITARRDIPDGQTLRYVAKVKGVKAGPASINVRAQGPGSGLPGGDTDTQLTVGGDGLAASLTIVTADEAGSTALPEGAVPKPLYPQLQHQPVGAEGLPQPHSDDPESTPGVQATSCVRGTWNYFDHNGNFRPSANFQVQVWDEDPASSDDLLGTVMTGADGGFNVCFDNDDGIGGGGNDVYVKEIAESPLWNIQRGENDPYVFRTETRDDVADGSTTDFGAQRPTDQGLMPVVELYDQVNAASNWTPGDCWDRIESACRRIPVNWTPTANRTNHYCTEVNEQDDCPRKDEVYLNRDAFTSTTVLIHEMGHGVMDDVYDDDYPQTNCPNPHTIQGQSEPGCAWSEGFAEWYPAQVTGSPTYMFPVVEPMPAERSTWKTRRGASRTGTPATTTKAGSRAR